MYWAKEALGEKVVNAAMRKLLAQFAFKGAPYANTTDFLKLLRAEAGPDKEQVISDLFDKITLLDLKATNAVVHKLPDGKYSVAFDAVARKFYADGAGNETEVAIDEPVEVGVFTEKPGSAGFDASKVLLLQTVPIRHDASVHAALAAAGGPRSRWISPFYSPDHDASHAPGSIPVTVTVDGRPSWVGIDPYNKRIDRNSDDNLTPVDMPR
jgi:ABC-2 type transport system permease protein